MAEFPLGAQCRCGDTCSEAIGITGRYCRKHQDEVDQIRQRLGEAKLTAQPGRAE